MRISEGPAQPAPSGSRLEAYDGASWRTWSALLLAGIMHGAFLLVAYLRPLPPPPRKLPPILMDVVVKPPPPPEPAPPEPPPPEPVPPPKAPQTPQVKPPPPSRSLPKDLQPVKRDNNETDSGPAIVVPEQPPSPPTSSENGAASRPSSAKDAHCLRLQPSSLATILRRVSNWYWSRNRRWTLDRNNSCSSVNWISIRFP